METEAKNIVVFVSSVTASLCYCYFVSSKLPKGIYRFISLIPVFYLFTILPLSFSYVFTTAIFASFTTWLTNFKLLRFAFDLDQSPFQPSKSLLHFITFASFPVKFNQQTDPPSVNTRKPKKFKLNLGFQILIFAVLVSVVYDYREYLHPKILLLLYCCLVFLLIDVAAAILNITMRALTGLEFEPSSDEPYLATSLQDFWGRRWNLMVTNSLRHTVYKPVRSALPDKEWAPLAAVLATFVVSGLMHELFVYQMSREDPTWEMTSFFVLHGICVVIEFRLKRAFAEGGKRPLPDYVSRLLTVGFVVVTGFWLFFPPLVRTGVDMKLLEEYMHVMDFFKTKLNFFLL